jgi:hypothetical protein
MEGVHVEKASITLVVTSSIVISDDQSDQPIDLMN